MCYRMSYTISIRVVQSDIEDYFVSVERTVWHYANGGTWTESNNEHLLTIGGSGTCGTLRYRSESGESFLVAVGVHNYKRWVDIVPDLAEAQTGELLSAEYYSGSKRARRREKQLSHHEVTLASGRSVKVNYTVADGHNLKADLIIG